MDDRTYLCIDLKSFFASVECVERGRDPLTTNLVVADESRTEKTICLAVSPSLKAYGLPGRARLFEVVRAVKHINAERRQNAPGHIFTGSSDDATELAAHPELELSYIVAGPQMAHYVRCSTDIYNIYLRYVAPEDIHVYSIDEVFIDLTQYMKLTGWTAEEFAQKMIHDVFNATGITATAGIGTNLYLAKIAMDIVAKHIPADKDGVRIAELDEMSYRRQLWGHRPLMDFWRVGRGYAKKLEEKGLYTMGDIARCSVGKPDDFYNEGLLYRMFGVNAELLIDHAWGWEPCTMADIKAYRPENNSICSGQVLKEPYDYDRTRIVIREMADMLVLDLVGKGLVTDSIVITIGYDVVNLLDPERRSRYSGPVETDHYGRKVPKYSHGTADLGSHTSSTRIITDAVLRLFDSIMDRSLLVRRINITADHVIPEEKSREPVQLDIFTDYEAIEKEQESLEREKKMQKTVLSIKDKFGKNAILRGTNLLEGATARDRNSQIGGHKA